MAMPGTYVGINSMKIYYICSHDEIILNGMKLMSGSLDIFPLIPLTAIRTLQSKEKRSRVLIKPITWEYSSLLFSDIFPVIFLMTFVQLGPIPPVVKKTWGSKDPFSVCNTRSSY